MIAADHMLACHTGLILFVTLAATLTKSDVFIDNVFFAKIVALPASQNNYQSATNTSNGTNLVQKHAF